MSVFKWIITLFKYQKHVLNFSVLKMIIILNEILPHEQLVNNVLANLNGTWYERGNGL
jgi:hypothetical protein